MRACGRPRSRPTTSPTRDEATQDEYAEVRIHKKKKPPKEKPTERAAKEKPAARAKEKPTTRAAPKGGGENVRLGTAGRLFMET